MHTQEKFSVKKQPLCFRTSIKLFVLVHIMLAGYLSSCSSIVNAQKLPDKVRVQNLLELKWGMFLHWSLGTFSGKEWTKGINDPSFFAAPTANTDEWCKIAKKAGMGYIIFVAKHHDGFCLWNTKTTDFKVTNSPVGKDVLAKLRRSCDKYGIELCLYFSEADWTWPDMENPELKAEQIKELFTQYGEIPLVWMDVAQWDGGLGHKETEAIIRKYQPNCFIGFNHGLPAGDLQSREMGTFDVLPKPKPSLPQNVIDSLLTLNKEYILENNWKEASIIDEMLSGQYQNYLAAECAICINQLPNGKRWWFYNEKMKDNALSANEIFEMYQKAVGAKVLFSLALGPDKEGNLREIDVRTLKEVGDMINKIN